MMISEISVSSNFCKHGLTAQCVYSSLFNWDLKIRLIGFYSGKITIQINERSSTDVKNITRILKMVLQKFNDDDLL